MSTTPIRYQVIFKDGPHEVPIFVGPFVSLTDAENFTRELPRPTPGGKVTVREIYGRDHLALIKEMISKDRKSNTKRQTVQMHA